MRRKNKPDKFTPPTNFIIEQSSRMRKLGYFLAAMGLFSAILIIPNRSIKDISEDAIPVYMIVFLLLFWTFIILPYNAITTKKKIIVKNGKFTVKSNRKKYRVNQEFKNLIWWREMNGIKNGSPEGGYQLHLKFPYQRVTLDYLDFKSLYSLEKLLKANYKEKKKTKSYP